MAKRKKTRSLSSGDSLGLFQGSHAQRGHKKDKHNRDYQNEKKKGPTGKDPVTPKESNPKANIGWLFAKDYYRDIAYIQEIKKTKNKAEADKKLSEIFSLKNNEITYKNFKEYIDKKEVMQLSVADIWEFSLTTQYPGLVTGSGIPHESDSKGEIKIGFSFDYTSGLPVIPGSSVKGVLRSAFQQADGEYIKFLLKAANINVNVDVEQLEKEIFDGTHGTEEKKTIIPVYERDIFFDAVIVNSGNENGLFLGEDFITPHPSPFKDPVPLLFLKVLPRVTFSFRFRLSTNKDVLLKPKEKLKLFEDIIRDLGIGAKTNVGYGKFD